MQNMPNGMTRAGAGALHWRYRQDMWKHPVALILLIKLELAICAGLGILQFGVSAANGDCAGGLKHLAIMLLGIGGFLVAITLLSWWILSLVRGNKIVYEFEMDESRIISRTAPADGARLRRLGVLSLLLDLFQRDDAPSAPVGLVVPLETVTRYDEVSTVTGDREHDRIILREHLTHNHIYAAPDQYDFVWQYIVSRCSGAGIQP